MKIAVLISGNGSNLQAIIDAIQNGFLSAHICVVISNRAEAYGLQRAKKAHIPTEIISHQEFPTRDAYDNALANCLANYEPDLIVLAGFMRILGTSFVEKFAGKIINIHPSLLPKYPGLNTHQAVKAAGDIIHGVSVHFVTADLDAGPLIAQTTFNVTPEDTAETLKQKVHQLEHRLYPQVISWYSEKRLQLINGNVFLDGKILSPHGIQVELL